MGNKERLEEGQQLHDASSVKIRRDKETEVPSLKAKEDQERDVKQCLLPMASSAVFIVVLYEDVGNTEFENMCIVLLYRALRAHRYLEPQRTLKC